MHTWVTKKIDPHDSINKKLWNQIFISVLLSEIRPLEVSTTWIFQCSRVKILLPTFCSEYIMECFCPLKLSVKVSRWTTTEDACLALCFGRVVGLTVTPSIFYCNLSRVYFYVYCNRPSRMLCKLQSRPAFWVCNHVTLRVTRCHCYPRTSDISTFLNIRSRTRQFLSN